MLGRAGTVRESGMSSFSRRLTIVAAIVVAAGASSGCSRIVGHQGYLIDNQLIGTVKPGVDNRDSVQRVLGRPTFTGQFDNRDWYYLGTETRQLAFGKPRPIEQTVMKISFDAAGNVAKVEQTGIEKVARIAPIKDKTPTLGRDRSFFQELFGNIGRVGSAIGGQQPTDNTGP
jgi:outer membrane protein assembly factor BamE (lipoprotein component of BamABCDE complex)